MTERQGLLLRAYLVYSLFVIGMVLVIVQVFRIQLDKTDKQNLYQSTILQKEKIKNILSDIKKAENNENLIKIYKN